MKKLFLISLLLLVAGCNSTTKTYQSENGTVTVKGPPSQYSKAELSAYKAIEHKAWQEAYRKYGEVCLKDLKTGQEVPRSMSVKSTECFNKYILEYVKPVSIVPKEVVGLTKSNLHFAKEYETTDMTFEQYQENLKGARDFYVMMLQSEFMRAN